MVSLFLKEVPLRGMSRANAGDAGGGFGMPEDGANLGLLEIAVSRLMRSEGQQQIPALRESSGSQLDDSDGWCVGQIRIRRVLGLHASIDEVSLRLRVPSAVLEPAFARAVAAGYLSGAER